MKRYSPLIVICLLILAIELQAADSAQISVTVTLENISVSVDPTSWAIGTVAAESATQSGTYTITNNGNVAEDISVQCGSSTDWTVVDTITDVDQFKMEAQGGDLGTSAYTSIHTSQTLKNNLAPSVTVSDVKLQFTAPQTGSESTQQSFAVTFAAAKYAVP